MKNNIKMCRKCIVWDCYELTFSKVNNKKILEEVKNKLIWEKVSLL